MIRHIVLFEFQSDLSEERQAAFHDAALGLGAHVPAIARLLAGPALALQSDSADYVLLLDFADEGAFRAYKEHPAHREFVARHVRPCVAHTTRAQLALD